MLVQSTVVNVTNGVNIKQKRLKIRVSGGRKFSLITKQLYENRRKIKELNINWSKDIFYQSRWLTKIMTKVMYSGKKSVAEKVLLSMVYELNQYSRGKSIQVFHEALEQIKPLFSTTFRRVGGRIYEIPITVSSLKQYKIGIHWLTGGAKKTRYPSETLVSEILGTIFLKRSETLRRKDLLYELVRKNRAYMHYRWV